MSCLGVNELSRRVYAKPIPGKKWIHLEPVLTDFLASPGFTNVSILSVDGEAALSVRNIQKLKKNVEKPWLKVIRSPTKAFLAERTIRTLKTRLAILCEKAKIHVGLGWRKQLQKAVHYCNTELKLENSLRPIDVNINNFLKVEDEINPISAPVTNPKPSRFKYQIGQKLFIKERALIFPDKLGKKRSLFGYKSTTQGVVVQRKIFSTGPRLKFLSPYYNLGNGWFREKDLIP